MPAVSWSTRIKCTSWARPSMAWLWYWTPACWQQLPSFQAGCSRFAWWRQHAACRMPCALPTLVPLSVPHTWRAPSPTSVLPPKGLPTLAPERRGARRSGCGCQMLVDLGDLKGGYQSGQSLWSLVLKPSLGCLSRAILVVFAFDVGLV